MHKCTHAKSYSSKPIRVQGRQVSLLTYQIYKEFRLGNLTESSLRSGSTYSYNPLVLYRMSDIINMILSLDFRARQTFE